MPAKEPTASSCVQQRLLDKVRYVRIGDRARQKRETVHSSSCWCVSALLYHARRGPMPGQAHKKGLRSSIAKQPQICPTKSKMKSWLHTESEDGTRQAFSHASAIKTKKSARRKDCHLAAAADMTRSQACSEERYPAGERRHLKNHQQGNTTSRGPSRHCCQHEGTCCRRSDAPK